MNLQKLGITELDILLLHADRADRSAALARPLLALNGLNEREKAYVPSEMDKRNSQFTTMAIESPSLKLKAFPNPAADFITIAYDLRDIQPIDPYWELTDMKGIVIANGMLVNQKDQKLISVKDILTGNYIISIGSGSQVVSSQQISIVH